MIYLPLLLFIPTAGALVYTRKAARAGVFLRKHWIAIAIGYAFAFSAFGAIIYNVATVK